MKIPVVKNTVTNYLSMGVRLLQGILVVRWLFECLGANYYGMWGLLWSFFSYALLLDFGFGVSAQKYTANGTYEKDIGHYNRIISTVFSFHLAMAGIVALGTYAASFFLGPLLNVTDPVELETCRTAFLIFGLGSAVIFPMGMFSEVLVGLHRMYVRNYINTISKLIELVSVIALLMLGGRLISLVILTVVLGLLTNATMAAYVRQAIPGFRLRLKIDMPTCREIAHFSLFAYLNAVARLILNKSGHILVSIFCGLPSVGLFHLASRLPDLCLMAASQYQENIRPMVASLHAKGEFDRLRDVIFNSMRWNTFVAIGVMLPCFLLVEPMLKLLFGTDDPTVAYMTRLFLVSMFMTACSRNIAVAYLQMAERHKTVAKATVFEAVFYLGLNIALLPRFGVECVVWTAIATRLIFDGCFLVPIMMRALRAHWVPFLFGAWMKPLLSAVPGAVLAVLFARHAGPSLAEHGWMGLLLIVCGGTALCAGPFVLAVCAWVLSPQERHSLLKKLRLVKA